MTAKPIAAGRAANAPAAATQTASNAPQDEPNPFVAVMQKIYLCLNDFDGEVNLMTGLEEGENGLMRPIPAGEMDEALRAKAELASIDRKGYANACKQIHKALRSGTIQPTSEKVWQIVFAIRGFSVNGFKRRPTFDEVEKIVKDKLGVVELTGAEMEARRIISATPAASVLGIPGTTVKAAYKDVAMPRQYDIELEDVPTLDNNGELIGEGRRHFLRNMHRMRGGLHPDPLMSRRKPTPKDGKDSDDGN